MAASLLTSPHFHPLLEGTLGFSFPGVRIPGLKEFLLNVRPSPKPGLEFVNMFWEKLFGCKLNFRGIRSKDSKADTEDELSEMAAVNFNSDFRNNSESLVNPVVGKTSIFNRSADENYKGANEKPVCTGSEDLRYSDSSYTDVSQVRISYNVYKAVYAIAHALHTLLNCDLAEYNNGMCERHKTFSSRHVS